MVMTKSAFDRIRKIVYTQTGISIQDGKESMVSTRLSSRIRALFLADEADYANYLAMHLQVELPYLVNAISTNFTGFFRESKHFDCLLKQMKVWTDSGQSRFRFWSAASSTGEEPFTLAITLLELQRKIGQRLDIRILATDLSTKVLEKATRAEYTEADLRGVSKPLLQRYFQEVGSGSKNIYRVTPAVRSLVTFHRLNLSTSPFAMKGPLDAVFCRNVMIYFDEKLRDDIVGECHRLLRSDGLLIVGVSESLVRSSNLLDRVEPGVYRKKTQS